MTIAIIIVTVLVSIAAFQNHTLFSKLHFNAYLIYHHREWYRLLTHGFLHVDYTHLVVNMIVLFMFGTAAEQWLRALEQDAMIRFPGLVYAGFYLSAIVISSLLSLVKNKDNEWYNSVGASGAVSAILFFNIFFNPWEKLYVYALIPVPGIILGVAYLFYSQYMGKKSRDNINHDAHFIGAVFGLLFPLLLNPKLINHFIFELMGR
ncbi:MAG: rhomboid family intramembrane serine protease [Bacteroidales bacterium]|nr:rhomboid family intramembrane serine protease [Bacteroidales bacterium]